jgi:hypothetical protein
MIVLLTSLLLLILSPGRSSGWFLPLLRFFPRESIAFLQFADKLLAVSGNYGQVVVGQLPPLLAD